MSGYLVWWLLGFATGVLALMQVQVIQARRAARRRHPSNTNRKRWDT